MRSDALAQAQLAVQKFAEEKEIARHLKTHFDAKSPLALQLVKQLSRQRMRSPASLEIDELGRCKAWSSPNHQNRKLFTQPAMVLGCLDAECSGT